MEGFSYVPQAIHEPPGLIAIVRVTNHSGHSLWYRGAALNSPDTESLDFVDGTWEWSAQRMRMGPSWKKEFPDEFRFQNGASVVYNVPVRERAEKVKAGLSFATCWLGTYDTTIWSQEFDVERPLQTGGNLQSGSIPEPSEEVAPQ
ncbi:MAG: hypothetical protein KF708_23055 [Pirellulales bacterium]|nr:hypothetical protein [Pirellulales bacterium]